MAVYQVVSCIESRLPCPAVGRNPYISANAPAGAKIRGLRTDIAVGQHGVISGFELSTPDQCPVSRRPPTHAAFHRGRSGRRTVRYHTCRILALDLVVTGQVSRGKGDGNHGRGYRPSIHLSVCLDLADGLCLALSGH